MARVAITGATGLLGGNLAAALIAEGHQVVATKRAGSKHAHLDDLAIEWRTAGLDDVAALTAAFTGCAAVFHCAAAVGVTRQVTREMRVTNVDGTANVIDAVIAAKVKRLVHTSSVVAIGLTTNGKPCDETAKWNFDQEGLVDGYAITKHQSEVIVTTTVRAGKLDAVIVNPTYMFGPRDARPSSGKLIVDIVQRKVPGWTDGYNNFVDVRDVARGMIAAWKLGRSGERYILGGHDMTYGEVMTRIAKVAGVRPPRFKIPSPIAYAIGWVGDRLEARGREPIVNSTTIRYAYTDKFRFTHAKASAALAYTPGPLEPAISDALAWFRAHRML